MSLYLVLKVAHIIGATVLLGTGAGIAFFMLMAHRTGDAKIIAHTAKTVVIADAAFTATAVVLQPITGVGLAMAAGYPLLSGWIVLSLALYVFVGMCWLPVVWIQLKMRELATTAAATVQPLPPAYYRLWKTWFALGFPAFASVLAIIWLMTARPSLALGLLT